MPPPLLSLREPHVAYYRLYIHTYCMTFCLPRVRNKSTPWLARIKQPCMLYVHLFSPTTCANRRRRLSAVTYLLFFTLPPRTIFVALCFFSVVAYNTLAYWFYGVHGRRREGHCVSFTHCSHVPAHLLFLWLAWPSRATSAPPLSPRLPMHAHTA